MSDQATVDLDTSGVDYGELVKSVAVFLGYDPDNLTDVQKSQIDGYVQSGVRNFYYPPKTAEGVDEHFEWSFLRRPTWLPVSAGADTYPLGYGFGRIAGQIEVIDDPGPTIPIIPYADIVRFRARGDKGRPRFATVIACRTDGSRRQTKAILLYPTPDRDYTLHFTCDADTGKLDAEDRPYPLGGAMFAELITESCLAVAEQRANDEEGLHSKKFAELLVSMIARDRKSSAQTFGDIGDPEGRGFDFTPIRTRGFLY